LRNDSFRTIRRVPRAYRPDNSLSLPSSPESAPSIWAVLYPQEISLRMPITADHLPYQHPKTSSCGIDARSLPLEGNTIVLTQSTRSSRAPQEVTVTEFLSRIVLPEDPDASSLP